MNFYKHYIGDFQRDTSHLSLTERGAYLALMHHYYATEMGLPDSHLALCRIAGAFTLAEKRAVEVAMGFFEVRNYLLWHKRIEAELEKSEKRCDKNREIALEREARKRTEKEAKTSNEASTKQARNVPESCHDRSTNEAPPPEPKPEPEEIPKKNKQKKVDRPVGVAESVWADFVTLREAKKSPITATALARIEKEAAKAEISLQEALEVCCSRGWQGFEAGWINQAIVGNAKPQAESFYAQDQRIKRERWEAMTGRKWPEEGAPSIDENIIDAEPFGLLEGDV